MLLASDIGGNAGPIGPSCSFPDSPTLESDAANDRRAALAGEDGSLFDPLDLYAVEMERDAAGTILAARFPDQLVSLNHTRLATCVARQWSRSSLWTAIIHNTAAGDVIGKGESPIAAVDAVIKARIKAEAPIRPTPIFRRLDASTGEAFGKIDPATAADFLELVEQEHGRSDFLTIAPDGRVLLAGVSVEADEAFAIGESVATHLLKLNPEGAIKVVTERQAGVFRTSIVLPNGERVRVGSTFTGVEARQLASRAIAARRSTIVSA